MLIALRRMIVRAIRGTWPACLRAQPKHRNPSARASPPAKKAVLALLQQTLAEGHTKLSLTTFYERMASDPALRRLPPEEVQPALQTLQAERRIRLTETHLALAHCVAAEQQIATGLAKLGSRLRPLNECQLTRCAGPANTRLLTSSKLPCARWRKRGSVS